MVDQLWVSQSYDTKQSGGNFLIFIYLYRPYPVWGNQEHLWPIRQATLNAIASPRVVELAEPKIDHSTESVMWVKTVNVDIKGMDIVWLLFKMQV